MSNNPPTVTAFLEGDTLKIYINGQLKLQQPYSSFGNKQVIISGNTVQLMGDLHGFKRGYIYTVDNNGRISAPKCMNF